MTDLPRGPGPVVVLSDDLVEIGGFATRYLADAAAVHGAYALLEHTLAPGLLGAPPHRHAAEDELSYVLSGELTVMRAGALTVAGPGAVVPKPRGEWHAFWNAGEHPVRFLELISPPGFAAYFRDLGRLLQSPEPPDLGRITALASRYGLEFDFEAIGPLMAAHGLRIA